MLPVKILAAAALVVLMLFFARRTPEDRVQRNVAPMASSIGACLSWSD